MAAETVQAVRGCPSHRPERRPLRFQVPGGVADHVQDELGLRQHRDVAACPLRGYTR